MINRKSPLSLAERLERLEETVENKRSLKEGRFSYSKEILDKCVRGTWKIMKGSYSGGYIYVKGSVDLSHMNLVSIKEEVGQFGEVTGNFDCSRNKLVNLDGVPVDLVGGNFSCHFNKLQTIFNSPIEVGGDFNCHNNRSLIYLRGTTRKVGGSFKCFDCKLITTKGSPKWIGGSYNIQGNDLNSTGSLFEGFPEYIGGDFNCKDNYKKFEIWNLRSIESNVKGNIYC